MPQASMLGGIRSCSVIEHSVSTRAMRFLRQRILRALRHDYQLFKASVYRYLRQPPASSCTVTRDSAKIPNLTVPYGEANWGANPSSITDKLSNSDQQKTGSFWTRTPVETLILVHFLTSMVPFLRSVWYTAVYRAF